VATILVAGVDVFFRGKLDALLGAEHRLTATDSVDPPDLVIVDIARVDPQEVAEEWPEIPILGFTNHTDTAGLRAGQAAGFDRVVVRSALAEPCIDIKDKSCVDVCPVDCIHESDRMLVIDPEECIDCGACEPECPVEAIFPEDALPEKWEPFVKINYAYGDGMDVVNQLVDEYATEHNVQNPPLDQR
jgi:ferredoxin